MNATDIMAAIEATTTMSVDWENTGGGVYNVTVTVQDADDVTIGHVGISENGDWTEGDEDSEVGFDGVTVIGYDLAGDSVCDERISADDVSAMTISEVLALVADMADAVRSTHAHYATGA